MYLYNNIDEQVILTQFLINCCNSSDLVFRQGTLLEAQKWRSYTYPAIQPEHIAIYYAKYILICDLKLFSLLHLIMCAPKIYIN